MRAKRMTTPGLAVILMTILLAGSPAMAGDDKSDLAGRAKAWQEAYNAGDAEALAALYTDSAMRLPYQAPTVEGRAGIVSNIQATREQGIAKVKLAVLGAESQGNMGWGHGTYALMDAEGAMVQQGKWMNVSKKVDGKWLIHCDIWNTNAP